MEAAKKMDAGDIWAFNTFKMRDVSKGEIYRNEVTQSASKGILQALENFKNPNFKAEILDYNQSNIIGKWNNKTTQKRTPKQTRMPRRLQKPYYSRAGCPQIHRP